MGAESDFEATDRRAAEIFAEACTAQNVKRIIYLGGLGNPEHKLSKHLRSRQEIGNILRTSTAAVVEFRASIIIGSGSLSFELIRALVEFGSWLWRIRGFWDLLVGGVGVRRGRRDDDQLRPGDALDFWRVGQIEAGRLLRLRAEMKVPGRAWLEFEVNETNGESTIRQTAIFDPVGVFGLAYWHALYPVHQFVFAGMLRNICAAVECQANDGQNDLTQTYSSRWPLEHSRRNARPDQ